jgi:magnesium transporter
MITTRLYRNGRLEQEGFDPARVSDHLGAPDALVWLDILDPTEEDLALCREEFGLHEEALNDVRERQQRTKVDQYGEFFVVAAYAVEGTPEGIRSRELHIFAGARYLLTFRFDPPFDLTRVLARWDSQPEMTSHGGGALLWVLLDELVDTYFPVIDAFDDAAEVLEARIFAETVEKDLQKELFELRKRLVDFRRYVVPLRDVLDLLQEDTGVVTAGLKPYFRDVYDNVYRALEFADVARDTITAGLSAYQAAVGNQMNLIMKKLTSWAAILLVPTAIAGIYGMNFDNMPELHTRYGYFAVLGVMAAACTTLYLAFKRRDWL